MLEIAIPLDAGTEAYSAARAVTRTFALSLGCKVTRERLDVQAVRALGPESVLAIHTEGDDIYPRIARGYPDSFVGEDD